MLTQINLTYLPADQDDIWFPNKLHRAWDNIVGGRCDVYSSDVRAFWPDGRFENIVKSMPQKEFDYLFEARDPDAHTCLKIQLLNPCRLS